MAVEGMPGTWSFCGVRKDHGPHRHRVVFNEGPYDNVPCLGYPGDPSAYVEPLGIVHPETPFMQGGER